MKLVMSILLISFLSACGTPPKQSAPPPSDEEMSPPASGVWRPEKKAEAPTPVAPAPVPAPTSEGVDTLPDLGYRAVKVFFATDRNQTGSKLPNKMFGVDWSSELSYGTCIVSIPRRHQEGELESPSLWKFQFSEDPSKHVVLLGIAVEPKDDYFRDLATSVRASKKTSALLFVHGYNTSFKDAARRTAQMSYDLQFEGVPVFYSWPSRDDMAMYMMDEDTIVLVRPNFKEFLKDFFERSDAQNIYLIAHSMGTRVLTSVVDELLTEQPALKQRLKEIILAAPDINAEIFKRQIAPALARSSQPITLYASSLDRALKASKEVHGYRRAGDSRGAFVFVPGLETIDATGMDTSLLGHSYFAETTSILEDMRYIFSGLRARERQGLIEVTTKEGSYWKFKNMQ